MAILLCGFTNSAQEPQQRTQEFVPVPREIVMPLVAVQPDCPLQFERVERLINVEGGDLRFVLMPRTPTVNAAKCQNRSAFGFFAKL